MSLRLIREAVRSAVSQPVASVVSIVIVAGMCLTVLLTTGRTAGAEQAVVSTIDSAGTRSIVMQIDPEAGVDSTVITRLGTIAGVEWSGAFGPATDVRTAELTDGTKVPLRSFYTLDPSFIQAHSAYAGENPVIASPAALGDLGLPELAGAVVDPQLGKAYSIVDTIKVPDFLQFMEPLLLAPASDTPAAPVSTVVVIAERPDQVGAVAQAAQSVLAASDPTKVSVSTSEQLANLRSLVQDQLGVFGRGLVVAIFALTAILVGTVLYALVMLRRRDFGRRRALGATRALIIRLLVLQTGVLSIAGSILGCVGAAVVLLIGGDPMPSISYFAATALLSCCAALLAALVPAIVASRRDPLKELRVP